MIDVIFPSIRITLRAEKALRVTSVTWQRATQRQTHSTQQSDQMHSPFQLEIIAANSETTRIRGVATKLHDARLEVTFRGKRCRTGRSFTRRETEANKHKPQSAPRARFATGDVCVAPRPRFTIASARRSSQKTRWNTCIHIKKHEPPTEPEHIERAKTNNCKTHSCKTRFED